MPKYGNNKIYVDDSVFQQKARKLARKLGVDEHKIVKEQTGILAREVAKMTPPYAKFPSLFKGTSVGTAKDIKQGEWAVYNDLRKICFVVPDDVANRTHRYTKGGPVYRRGKIVAPRVIVNLGELATWHKRNEDHKGRTRDLDVPHLPWMGENLFMKYVKSQQANVGIAKAAFYKASVQLGAKGAAVKGIKRHLVSTSGNGRMAKTSKGPYGLISGRAKGLWHVHRHLPQLERNRLIKAVKRLEYVNRQAVKNAGFKTR